MRSYPPPSLVFLALLGIEIAGGVLVPPSMARNSQTLSSALADAFVTSIVRKCASNHLPSRTSCVSPPLLIFPLDHRQGSALCAYHPSVKVIHPSPPARRRRRRRRHRRCSGLSERSPSDARQRPAVAVWGGVVAVRGALCADKDGGAARTGE